MSRHRIVIIGSGFAGLTAARRSKKDADITNLAQCRTTLPAPALPGHGHSSEGDIAPTTRDPAPLKNVTRLSSRNRRRGARHHKATTTTSMSRPSTTRSLLLLRRHHCAAPWGMKTPMTRRAATRISEAD